MSPPLPPIINNPPSPSPIPPFSPYSNLTHTLDTTTHLAMSWNWKRGMTVPPEYVELRQTYIPGYIVLSYIIAVVGSLCTLELLLRRTSNRGLYNVLLLITAGICFGSVSTFSMHFIGNNSLVLHHPLEAERGYPSLTLAYNAGYTVLSLVVSCLCMIGAFFVMGLEVDWRWMRGGLWRRRRGREGEGVGSEESETSSLDVVALDEDPAAQEPGSAPKAGKGEGDAKANKKKAEEMRAKMRSLEMKTKVNTVMDKLEWALGWSMVDFGGGGNGADGGKGTTAAERRRRKWEEERARDKARDLEGEGGVRVGRGTSPAGAADSPPRRRSISMDDNTLYGHKAAARKLSWADAEEGNVLHPMPLPLTALPQVSRRASMLDVEGIQPAPMSANSYFTPSFAFPPRSDQVDMTQPAATDGDVAPDSLDTSLPPQPQPQSQSPAQASTRTRCSSHFSGRRASVPVNSPRDYILPSFNLARIQSAPDDEQKDPHKDKDHLGKDDYNAYRYGKMKYEEELRREREVEEERAGVIAKAVAEVRSRESLNTVEGVGTGLKESQSTSTTHLTGNGGGGRSRKDSSAGFGLGDSMGKEYGAGMKSRRRRRKSGRKVPPEEMAKWKRWLGLDVVTETDIVKIVVAGTICGWGIAGMHYIGQKSIISIPYVAYSIANVVGSVIVACAAVIVALYIMFIMLRPKLKRGWVVRVAVACVLGAAVCFMHYLAMGGTTYALVRGVTPPRSAFGATKKMITGIVAALACLTCLCILTFIVIEQVKAIAHRRGRRKVMIATMIYDEDDRLLVSPDGVLPMCDIAAVDRPRRAGLSRKNSGKSWESESSSSSVLDTDLSTSHPAFIAALRSTWAWRQPGVVPAGPGNAPNSLTTSQSGTGSRSGDVTSPRDSTMSPPTSNEFQDFGRASRRISTISIAESAIYPSTLGDQVPLTLNVGKFMDRFTTAVAYLAHTITGDAQNVKRLGVLYDRMLTTGHVSVGGDHGRKKITISKGQLIFLVRRVTTTQERSALLARNFLFAEPHAVASVMARVLAVPVQNFLNIIDDQRDFCDEGMSNDLRPGRLYAGMCMIQPTTNDGIHICVDRARRHQLPMRELCNISTIASAMRTQSTALSDIAPLGNIEEIGEALLAFEGQTLFDLIAPRNELLSDQPEEDPSVIKLREMLINTLIPLLDSILSARAMTFVLPRLIITPQLIPLSAPFAPTFIKPTSNSRFAEVSAATSMPWAIVFKAVLPIDAEQLPVDMEPWTLFKAQQECVLREGKEGLMAARMASAYAAQTSPKGQPVFNPARRPSKVQWSTASIAESLPTSPGAHRVGTPEAVENGQSDFPFSSAFKADLPSSFSDRNNTGKPRPLPDLNIKVPRRSSLAPSVYDSGVNSSIAVETSGLLESPMEAAPGVGLWHADWLTRILRAELYNRPSDYDTDF